MFHEKIAWNMIPFSGACEPMDRLEGIFCALWTPTGSDGEILWDAFEAHLSFVLQSRVAGIMALGSTGEFPHLTLPQRKQLLERIVFACKARGRRVIANVSDIQIRNVIELARHAKSLSADCISVLPPWYFPLEQRDLAEFFIEVGRRSEMPLALYNYPEVTGKKIALGTIEKLAPEVKLIAVKQSGAEYGYHTELLALGKHLGFPVLTGADTRLEESLTLGCSGTVSGLANVCPEILCTIYENFRLGKSSPDKKHFVTELSQAIRPLDFPLNVKAAMAGRGFETGKLKMPVSAQTWAVYEGVVRELQVLFRRLQR